MVWIQRGHLAGLSSLRPRHGLHILLLWCSLGVAGLAQAAWTAAIRPDPITRQPRCLLSSNPQSTSDGYDTTPVTLVFNGSHLLVVTQSELDLSFNDLQLIVDKNPPLRSTQINRQMILVFDQDAELLRQLRTGHQITVYLRFWPTWPVTEAFALSFSLIGFSKAYDAFNHGCQPPGPSQPPG